MKESGNRVRRWLWRLGNLAAFLMGFAAVAWVLAPRASIELLLQAKLDHFERHKDEYDLVFFGSSRPYRAFDPPVFSAEMARHGREIRAFNFGIGAMRPHEMDALMRRVLAMRPERLRWVLIELMDWEPTILERLDRHPRTIAWHDPHETWSACRTVRLADVTVEEKCDRCCSHLWRMTVKLTNWGQGPRRVDELLGTGLPGPEFLQLVARRDGFVAVDDETSPHYAQRRWAFLHKYHATFRRQIRDIPIGQSEPASLAHFNVAATVRQQTRIRRAGAVPVYVVPNVHWGTPVFHRLARDGLIENFIALNDPQAYPALYEDEHYFDQGHLNRLGARHFSVLLARQFAGRIGQP